MPLLRRITRNTSSSISPARYWATARSKRSMSRCCSASRSRGVVMAGVIPTATSGEIRPGCSTIRRSLPMRQRRSQELHRSGLIGRLADLPERVTERGPQAPCVAGSQVEDKSGAWPTHLLHRQHDPRLGIVVVVTDGHGPRQPRRVFRPFGQIRLLERLVVDGTAHRVYSFGAQRRRTARCAWRRGCSLLVRGLHARTWAVMDAPSSEPCPAFRSTLDRRSSREFCALPQ